MNLFRAFTHDIKEILAELEAAHQLPTGLDITKVTVEPPREANHGDLSTNAAMVLTKAAGKSPRQIAELLIERLRTHPSVASVEIAGPGFINIRLKNNSWQEHIKDILKAGLDYGNSEIGHNRKVNIEFVSTNPTGPMHVAHTRGAIVGDVLAALLQKVNYQVTREYYINDAGAQVDTLAKSAYLRYQEALGQDIGEIPAGLYPGEYLKAVGQALAKRDNKKWLGKPENEWLPTFRSFAVDQMMNLIRQDLERLGVKHDVFTSERALLESGAVDKALKTLEDKGLIYTGVLEPPKGKTIEDWEPRPQLLFKASLFGDDIDRPLKKSDGSNTYFANDIAYHFDKFKRGYSILIDVLGADHSGYVKRMKAATTAITDGKADLDIKVCQLVHLLKDGQPVKMSKRAGNFVTVQDLLDEVGPEVIRFIMLTRRNDQALDFDFTKVLEQSKDNPVFYVQYAHARCCSVLRHAIEAGYDVSLEALTQAPTQNIIDEDELGLIKVMAHWPRIVEGAAEAHEPHRLAFYLQDLAAAFHALWNKGKDHAHLRFILEDNRPLTLARLALVKAVATVIASGLHIIGVEPVQEMRS